MPIIFGTVEIVREDYVVILEIVVPYRDLIVTHIIPSIVQNCKNENEFTNDDLITLSRQIHEQGGNSRAKSSELSSNSSPVFPDDDDDLYVKQLFETKKDLQEVMHQIVLNYNFEFKVKKSNKSLLTII